MNQKPFILVSVTTMILFFIPVLLPAAPLYFSAWGFRLDLPEGYTLVEGNNKDRYSFQNSQGGPLGAYFDIAVYNGVYQDVAQLSNDIERRLGNEGDIAFFEYGTKAAALMELRFRDSTGWGLCVELGDGNGIVPLLLVLSYAPAALPAGKTDMDLYHFSALDSLVPSEAEKRFPGPIMEFGYPRGSSRETTIAGTNIKAMIRENDAEAAQALIDREFALLRAYQSTPAWQEAWIRFYRMIYRDSWDRVTDALSQLERNWNKDANKRTFAERTLVWVQGFQYERNLAGSDFVNLVSAVTEGRGDCDSRAMLWAMSLMQARIPAAIMVSRDYSHAMGLADIAGNGARFKAGETNWLVAETTARVSIGSINKDMSNTTSWLGVLFY
jgi:hypothetical protein